MSQRRRSPRPWRRRTGRRAFSTTELMILVPVLAILLVLLFCAIGHGRGIARDVVCRSNLGRLGIATGSYANSYNGTLFANLASPLLISNVVYRTPTATGWGLLYPRHLGNYHVLFCPSDPGRGPAWEYGWSNWGAEPPDVPPPHPGGGGGRRRGWDDPQPGQGHQGGERGKRLGWDDPQPDHGNDGRGHQGGERGKRLGWGDRGHGPRGRGPRPGPGHGPTPVAASEVQCSYGYRGRQGLVPSAGASFTVSNIESNPQKVLGCDFHEPFFAPPRVHHAGHVNVVRLNGQVERVDATVSFGPTLDDFDRALDALDR